MDPERDLEEFRRTCILQEDLSSPCIAVEDKEIVVRDLSYCRLQMDRFISVKALPHEGGGEAKLEGLDDIIDIDIGSKDTLSITTTTTNDRKPDVGRGGGDCGSSISTVQSKIIGVATAASSSRDMDFSTEDSIPDSSETKVYDFVMSKEQTLPNYKFSMADLQHLKRSWLCIGTLLLATLLVVIVVTVFLILTTN